MTDTDTHTLVEVDTCAGRVRGAWRDIPGSEARSAAFLWAASGAIADVAPETWKRVGRDVASRGGVADARSAVDGARGAAPTWVCR